MHVVKAPLTASPRVEDLLKALAFLVLGVLLLAVVPEASVSWRPLPGGAPPVWTELAALVVAALGETQRRARPVLGLGIASAALLAGVLVIGRTPVGVVIMFGDMLYCAVLHSSRRRSWAVSAAAGLVLAGMALLSLVADGGRAAVLSVLSLSMLLGVPVVWAIEVRRHREQAAVERERAEQAHRMAELDRAAAVTAERARMARDLHDVIAGQLSAIAIQSTAALNLPDPHAATLRRVLEAVRRDSVASLTEMRAMIGLLRADGAGDGDPRTSPPGLDRLDVLVDTARATGLRVEVHDRRSGRYVPAAVDLAAYRIVQEALTNAAKHAPGSRVRLSLGHREGAMMIELENELVPGAPQGDGTGVGLLGLRERAQAVGGTVQAGPHGRGWRVAAALPVAAPVGVAP
jgi:signal transduction histidine kinase